MTTFWTIEADSGRQTCCEECALNQVNLAVDIWNAIVPANLHRLHHSELETAVLDMEVTHAMMGRDLNITSSEVGICSVCGVAFDGAA